LVDGLDVPLLGAYLKALFHTGQTEEFARRWDKLKQQGKNLADPELALYRSANLSGWAKGQEAEEGKRQLAEAMQSSDRAALAHRLNLRVSEHLQDVAAYRKSLEHLEENRQAVLADRLGLVQMLSSLGRKPEAIRELRASPHVPKASSEVIMLARTCATLGLDREARDLLRKFTVDMPEVIELWLVYGNLLIEQERWDDLTDMAALLRLPENPAYKSLVGYACYAEGVAALMSNRQALGRKALDSLRTVRIEDSLLALSIAANLERLGFHEIAQHVLLTVEKDRREDPNYWFLMAKTAYEIRDARLLVKAMENAFKLKPTDPAILQNYAAALLTARERDQEALGLTRQLADRYPESPAAKINYASALTRNGRPAQAKAILLSLDLNRLDLDTVHAARLAWFETYHASGEFAQARSAAEKIDRQALFPNERVWFDRTLKEIKVNPTGPDGKSSP
jgi:predicted Zn-dependent protease